MLSGSNEAKAKIEKLTKEGAILDFVSNEGGKKFSLKDIAASIQQDQVGLNKAIENKDRLLNYDRQSVARSKVYDDQVDYFTMRTQNFVSDEKRRAIQHKIDYLVENKFNKESKIMLDLENMTVNDYSESVIKDLNEEHKQLEELSAIKTDYKTLPAAAFIEDDQLRKNVPPAVYIPSDSPARTVKQKQTDKSKKLSNIFSMENFSCKVQDTELEKIEDRGMCLAMHQPYASLLVAGIKRFEGRTWYSTFKGRLWIYAAQRKPTTEEITAIEKFYTQLGYTKFPRLYPTGVMVGCVTVDDCLPNEVYRDQYPECEIDSPYAFVCTYPITLTRPLPVLKGGGNRIYKLEGNIHKACKTMLGF